MIGYLRGKILEKHPPLILVETHGVGYEIYMPMTCFYTLPAIGQETVVFTHFIVRKDMQLLYGFNDKPERALFRELIKINGVGPKLALAILSGMSAQQFIRAVKYEEITLLIKLPGVGKKIAKRLVMEMKDYFKGLHGNLFVKNTQSKLQDTVAQSSNNDAESDAISALVTLGYKLQEANRMISDVSEPGIDCESLIRNALCTML